MRRAVPLCALLTLGCASGTAHLSSRPTDLDLVTSAVSACVDTVVTACESLHGNPLRVGLTGGGDGAWLVRSLLEDALLDRQFSVRESTEDSTTNLLDIRIVELGVRHRGIDRRGILMKPWVLREGACALVARALSPSGEVAATARTADARREWTPARDAVVLSHPTFSPSAPVPTIPGLIAPLAVAGVVGTLLALFFVTSE